MASHQPWPTSSRRPSSPPVHASLPSLRAGERLSGPEEAEPGQWFENWERDGSLFEDTLHLGQWDQTLTLLWFDDEALPPPASERKRWDEETYGLRELDGILPWPGRSKKRK